MRSGCRSILGLALAGLGAVVAGCGPPSPREPAAFAPPEPIDLVFEARSLERQSPGCEGFAESSAKGPAGCAEISLSWVEVADAPAGVARAAIHEWIEAALLTPTGDGDLAESPEQLAKRFLADFATFHDELPDGPGWFLERTVEPIHDDEQGVSFRLTDSSYLGGAHPNTVTLYSTLYLTTGRPVALEDLLVDGDPARLLELAEAGFRQARELSPDEDLVAAGFWPDREGLGVTEASDSSSGRTRFPLAESFALTGDGLLFHYNPYEIGPYALGATTFTIPWAELEGIVAWSGLAPGAQAAR